MKKRPKARPAILVRMYAQDIRDLSMVCADQCTPRENYARRCILSQMRADMASMKKIEDDSTAKRRTENV
jgi:hypothetical protein